MKSISKILIAITCAVLALTVVSCSKGKNPSGTLSTASTAASTEASVENSVGGGASTSTLEKVSYPSAPQVYYERESAPAELALENVKVYLVGDSTVCEYTEAQESSRFYMRNGYGMRLGEYLYKEAEIVNKARSGRSSVSYMNDKEYREVMDSLNEGDFLIIGFGHNDQKSGTTYTDPNGGIDDEGSFKYSLYHNYIEVAIQMSAKPILCTPIVRRSANGSYSGAKIHQANGGDYAQAIRELGEQLNIPVIDLTTATQEFLTGMPEAESAQYFSWSSSYSTEFVKGYTSVDDTHLNAYGAEVVAKMIAELLKETNSDLKAYVRATLPEPNKEVLVPMASK